MKVFIIILSLSLSVMAVPIATPRITTSHFGGGINSFFTNLGSAAKTQGREIIDKIRFKKPAPIGQIPNNPPNYPHAELFPEKVSSGKPFYQFDGEYHQSSNQIVGKVAKVEEAKQMPVRIANSPSQLDRFQPHSEVLSEVGDPVYKFA
jgi:hypothetical protein